MSKLKVHDTAARAETPSESIIAVAAKTATVVDERGRTITIKRLGPLDRMRLFKAVGVHAKNEMYVGYASLAASVTELDGDRVPSPNSEREVEALVEVLGDEGLEAIGKAVQENFMSAEQAASIQDAAKN